VPRESGENADATGRARLRSGLGGLDLLGEALAGSLARPARAALTALGTVLGVAAIVATLGIARTAGSQILARFDELAATEVTVTAAGAGDFGGGDRPAVNALPLAADERVARLNGVAAAGSFSAVEIGGSLVQAVPVVDPLAANAIQLPVVAASPGLLEAARGTMATGRWFDPIHDERAERVAVLGPGAAARLNVDRVDHQPTVFIGDEPVVVIGILEDVARQADLLGAVIIPEGTAATRFGLAAPDRVVVDTEIGAAQLIGTQVALALSPNEPSLLAVRVPPDLRSARSGAEGDVNALFLVLGLVSLVVGALGIANVTLVSVLERVGEIGLRRALGATRRSITTQFLVESATLGALGGLVGASAGTIMVVLTAAAREWTPLLDLSVAAAGPVAGAVVGLAAGAYPAWRAGCVEPADALRGGV
jgi:ABC-type antimicrobial peptide transport system permease subunit